MPAKPLRPATVVADQKPTDVRPLLPTLVVGSFKGGVWKTSIAVALAERLAFAGLRVLMLTSDQQEDARYRLGIASAAPGTLPRVPKGSGHVAVISAPGPKTVNVLYNQQLREVISQFDVAVLDTPPMLATGALAGVHLVSVVDGIDAVRNLIAMLRPTPENTKIIVTKVRKLDVGQWLKVVEYLDAQLTQEINYIENPLPESKAVEEAHNDGVSVWTLARRGATKGFLDGIETLARTFWEDVYPDRAFPDIPPLKARTVTFKGWGEDED